MQYGLIVNNFVLILLNQLNHKLTQLSIFHLYNKFKLSLQLSNCCRMSSKKQVCKKKLTPSDRSIHVPSSSKPIEYARKSSTPLEANNEIDSSDSSDESQQLRSISREIIDNKFEIDVKELRQKLAIAEQKERDLESRVALYEIGFLAYKTAHALHREKVDKNTCSTQTGEQQLQANISDEENSDYYYI